MPIIINHDLVAPAINASLGTGALATAQATQEMALRNQQAQIAQQDAALRNYQAQTQIALSARNQNLRERQYADEMDLRRAQLDANQQYRYDALGQRATLQDDRQAAAVELQRLRDDNAAGRLSEAGKQRQAQLEQQFGYRQDLQESQNDFTAAENELNRQSHEQQTADRIAAQKARDEAAARMRQQLQVDQQRFSAAQQKARSDAAALNNQGRIEAANQRAAVANRIQQLQWEAAKIHDDLANYRIPDNQTQSYIQRYNQIMDELNRLVPSVEMPDQSIGAPLVPPAPGPAAPTGQAAGNFPLQLQAQGSLWRFTGQFAPNGEPVYVEVA